MTSNRRLDPLPPPSEPSSQPLPALDTKRVPAHVSKPAPGLQSPPTTDTVEPSGQPSQAVNRDETSPWIPKSAPESQSVANLAQPGSPQKQPTKHTTSISFGSHRSSSPWQYQNPVGTKESSVISIPPPSSSQQSTVVPQAVTRDDADIQPWRYRGYPAFSKWMASDDDFFVIRRFETVSARVILHLQDQIAQLEEALQEQDQLCRQAANDNADGGTFRSDRWERRLQILTDLASSLERYQKFILDHSALKARPKASTFQINNVVQWLKDANEPIASEEVAYLEEQDDLIPISSKEKTPLRRFIDRFNLLAFLPCIRDRNVNRRRYEDADFERDTTVYYKDHLVDKFVTCLIMILGLGMLIGPLWWLQNLSVHHANLQIRLGVITAFLILFATLISILAKARPFEVLAATAAYGAVLMVYMQLGTNRGGGGNS